MTHPTQTTSLSDLCPARLQVLRIVDGFADDAADEVEEVQVVSCDIGPGDRRFFMVVLMAKYGKITVDWVLLGF